VLKPPASSRLPESPSQILEAVVASALHTWLAHPPANGSEDSAGVVRQGGVRAASYKLEISDIESMQQLVQAAVERLRELPESRLKLHASVFDYLREESEQGGPAKEAVQLSTVSYVDIDVERSEVAVAAVVAQDAAVAAAEAVAGAALAALRSDLLSANHLSALRAALPAWLRSTRALERFRNEVMLFGLMEQNVHSVIAIFEDRHLLWGYLPDGGLLRRRLPMSRQDELGQLTGWRQGFSVTLEVADVIIPLIRSTAQRIGEAMSYILVTLIGRSLGLVYKGIKQSVSFQGKQNYSEPSEGRVL